MKDGDRADIVIIAGMCSLLVALTDALFRYLRPGMRPFLIAAGAVLVALGVAAALLDRRSGEKEASSHHRPSRVGWLVLAPIVVGLAFDPGALGSYAVMQASSGQITEIDFDLEAHLETHSLHGQIPQLQLLEFAWATYDREAQELLRDTPVRLVGFIAHIDGDEPFLARLQMGCCAGDAFPSTVRLEGVERPLDDDTWVEVTGTLDPRATRLNDDGSPVMVVTALREVKEPKQPYEFLR